MARVVARTRTLQENRATKCDWIVNDICVCVLSRKQDTGRNASFVLQLYASNHPRAPGVAAADYISTRSSLHVAYFFQKFSFNVSQ